MKKQHTLLIIFSILIIFLIALFMFFNVEKKDNLILIENENITILNNSNYNYKAFCTQKDCSLKYKSSNESIFTVTDEGDINSHGLGEATLTIESEDAKKEVIIYVTENESMITGINIKEEELKLDKDDKYLLQVEIFPGKAVLENLEWTSSDTDVITVNNGYIEAEHDGEAIVTVRVSDTDISDKINIKVGKGATEKVKNITFEQEVITMGLNETYQLTPIIRPINASGKNLTYIVDDISIIEIDENGLITSKAKGKTNVNVLATNGVATSIEVKVEPSEDDLVISTDEIVISIGESYQLRSNYVKGIEWYSNNNKVVTVNSSGLLKGISPGEAIVTVVNSYGRINTIKIIVKESIVPVTSIVLDKKEVSLRPGGSYKINASILPNNATNKELYWETSDSRIATVTDDGTIMALRTGEAIITVYSNNSVQETVKVIVSPTAISIDSLEISPSNITLLKGDSYTLNAKIIPSNALNQEIKWQSADSSIVSVNENGKIIAHKTGSTVITAISNGLVSKITVEVKNSVVELTNISINESDLNLKVGETIKLSTSFLPSNATNKNFIWESSNNVASISNTGLVTALNPGTATITVKSTNGKSDSIKVVVTQKSDGGNSGGGDGGGTTNNSVTEVLLNLQNINLHIGQTKQLKATVLPLNAVNSSLTWISSNDSVVTVSSSGLLTGVNSGTAQISVITANGKVARANVTVTKPPIYDSGSKIINLQSEKLIVTMTKHSETGIRIIRIWAANPYAQFHKADSSSSSGSLVKSIIDSAISANNLQNSIVVGGNSAISNSGGRTIGNLIITEGNVILNNPGGNSSRGNNGNTLFYAGITSSGDLEIYCTNPKGNCGGGSTSAANEKKIFDEIISDGVKNTIAMTFENILVLDGKVVRDPGWGNGTSIRNSFCQVDSNNFIIMISSNGDTIRQVANLQASLGCETGINLDGGGSANVFYKNRGSSNVNMIYSTTRKRPDAIYFSEY